MNTRKLIVLLLALVFTFGVVGLSFWAEEIKGTVSKIDGNKLTVQDDMGKQITESINDPGTLQNLKVGDRVSIKDGKLTKEKT